MRRWNSDMSPTMQYSADKLTDKVKDRQMIVVPKGEYTQLIHDVQFSSLIEVEHVGEQTRIPIKVKLLLLNIIVITHLQQKIYLFY